DFEDALQNYAAEKMGDIDVILTRNTKDFKNSELGVMTPENYLKTKIASR
ncbi:MAG: PIN domain-containing protein, partial [Candidatus Marinimicrobia bacterium]|nr:PIN domain-containing protein [Candidatus Neomarinimicrobiota bacterium]